MGVLLSGFGGESVSGWLCFVLEASQQLVQAGVALFPELAVVGQPDGRLAQGLGFQVAEPGRGPAAAGDETGLLEDLQVPRDGRLRDAEWSRQLSDVGVALGQPRQDRPPRRVRKGAEHRVQLGVHHLYNRPVLEGTRYRYPDPPRPVKPVRCPSRREESRWCRSRRSGCLRGRPGSRSRHRAGAWPTRPRWRPARCRRWTSPPGPRCTGPGECAAGSGAGRATCRGRRWDRRRPAVGAGRSVVVALARDVVQRGHPELLLTLEIVHPNDDRTDPQHRTSLAWPGLPGASLGGRRRRPWRDDAGSGQLLEVDRFHLPDRCGRAELLHDPAMTGERRAAAEAVMVGEAAIAISSGTGWSGGTSTPSIPSRMVSGIPPTAEATTGRPAAMASSTARPCASRRDGKTARSNAATTEATSRRGPPNTTRLRARGGKGADLRPECIGLRSLAHQEEPRMGYRGHDRGEGTDQHVVALLRLEPRHDAKEERVRRDAEPVPGRQRATAWRSANRSTSTPLGMTVISAAPRPSRRTLAAMDADGAIRRSNVGVAAARAATSDAGSDAARMDGGHDHRSPARGGRPPHPRAQPGTGGRGAGRSRAWRR